MSILLLGVPPRTSTPASSVATSWHHGPRDVDHFSEPERTSGAEHGCPRSPTRGTVSAGGPDVPLTPLAAAARRGPGTRCPAGGGARERSVVPPCGRCPAPPRSARRRSAGGCRRRLRGERSLLLRAVASGPSRPRR